MISPQIENEIKEEQKVKSALSEPHAKLSDIFNTQRKKEDDMIAEKHSLSKRYICLFSTLSSLLHHGDYLQMYLKWSFCFRLEENKRRHDEDIISIAKCRFEIKNMKEEMRQLHDANMYGPVFCFMVLSYYIQINSFIPLFEWLSLRISADMFRKTLEELEGQLAKQNMSRSV